VDDSQNFEPPADDEALLDARPPRRRVLGIKITTHNVAYPSFFQKLGPRIYEVAPGSKAAEIGIKADDMLLELDGNSVESITGAGQDQASAVLQYLSDNSRHSIILTIKRADQTELIKLVVPAE
jgi:S1-C subfamily serine protease